MNTTSYSITTYELCECEDITASLVEAAVEHEIVAPLTGQKVAEWVFDATHVVWIRKAIHLRQDLDLDWVATAMLIDLLREKEQLQRANRVLEQRIDRLLDEPETLEANAVDG